MRINILLISIIVALLFLTFSTAADDGENGLPGVDAFHPPDRSDPRKLTYNEWHYFNIIDEEQDLYLITTFKLNGDIYDPVYSAASVLISYITPEYNSLTLGLYPITSATWSEEVPDVRIGPSSVIYLDEIYYLHVESEDGNTILNAMFKPLSEPAPIFSASFEPQRVVNWLVTSSRMKVTGTITINAGTPEEKIYALNNARGYHDHNWGYWLWQDDIGWDWGQAMQTRDMDNPGRYTFSFGNVTNNDHTESRGAVFKIWKNRKMTSIFSDDEIQVQYQNMNTLPMLPDNPFPTSAVITTVSDTGSLNILFTASSFTPIPLPAGEGKYLVIWELTGTYEVNGYINGKPVSYTTIGFYEYVA